LSRRSLAHVKAFLSGIYTFARNHGHFDGANPATAVKLPKAKPPEDTHAYSLKEETAMMTAVKSDRGRLAIAIASYTGVDKGELEALRWEDRVNGDFQIRRKIWCGKEKEPKTEKRKAPIPVIPHLAKMLDAHRKRLGASTGWIFPASRGTKPTRMDNLAKREIIPDLKAKGLYWHGWHAFRRGWPPTCASSESRMMSSRESCDTRTSALLRSTMPRRCRLQSEKPCPSLIGA
jgi:integrase